MLQRQVLRLRAAGELVDSEFRGLYIPDSQADALLRRRSQTGSNTRNGRGPETIETLPSLINQTQRENAERLSGAPRGTLPLAVLADEFELGPVEIDALLLAAAPDLDTGYGTLFAYAQNDATSRRP